MGNDAAGIMADLGRALHDIGKHIAAELKTIEHNGKLYHRWTAFAAAAQHNGNMVPDHDKRDKPKRRKQNKETRDQNVGPTDPQQSTLGPTLTWHGDAAWPASQS